MPNTAEILRDPEFLGLPPQEQVKVLSSIDPDFAGLPPEEQVKVVQSASPSVMGQMKAAGSGLAEGAIGGTIGAIGDLRDMKAAIQHEPPARSPAERGLEAVRKGFQMGSPFEGAIRGMAPSTAEIAKLVGIDYEPKNRGERYVKSATAGAGGMVLPMGKLSAAGRGVLGTASGAAGEIGAEVGGDNVLARLIGSMLPLIAHGAVAGKKPQVVKATQDFVREVDAPNGNFWKDPVQSKLTDAAIAQKGYEKTLGAPFLLTQGLDTKTPLSGITAEVMKSPQGEAVRRVLERQLPVGQEKIDTMLRGLSEAETSQGTANKVLEAGDKAITRPERVRAKAVERQYRQADNDLIPTGVKERTSGVIEAVPESGDRTSWSVPKTDVLSTVEKLRAERERLNLDVSAAGKPFSKYEEKLLALVQQYPDGVPVLKIDALRRDAATMVTQGAKAGAGDKARMTKLGHETIARVLNEATSGASEALATGRDRFSRISQTAVDEVQKSPLTTMFTEGARDAGKGNWSEFSTILDNPTKYGPTDIRFVGEHLRRADPKAFPAIVKQNFMDKFEKSGGMREGRTDPRVLGEFPEAIAGAPGSPTRENFRETMRQVALAHGEDAATVVKGAENLVDALQAAARERGQLGEIASSEFRRQAGANVPSAAGRSANLIAPLQGMARAFERHLQRRTYSEIASILTTGEGVGKLREIAGWSATDSRTRALVQDLLTLNAQQKANEPENTKK